MAEILLDSNILIDISSRNQFYDWSSSELTRLAGLGYNLHINQISYAEISAGFPSIQSFEDYLNLFEINKLSIPHEAGFLAGFAYRIYKKRGGIKTSLLSDFFIGAHATYEQIPLLTRNAKDYKQYFPKLELITP